MTPRAVRIVESACVLYGQTNNAESGGLDFTRKSVQQHVRPTRRNAARCVPSLTQLPAFEDSLHRFATADLPVPHSGEHMLLATFQKVPLFQAVPEQLAYSQQLSAFKRDHYK